MKRIGLMVATAIFFAAVALAQGDPPPVPEPSLPKGFLVALLGGVPLIVALGQLIRKAGIQIPGWLRALLPTAIGFAGTFLSNWAGITVDLSPIVGALMGTAGNATFDVLKEAGLVTSSGGK